MNRGPTVRVFAQHGDVINVMAAAWACVLHYGQTPRATGAPVQGLATPGMSSSRSPGASGSTIAIKIIAN